MMKLTKRKGFNFFRSYFDVYNELDDKNKVAFIDALFNRQFLGIKPTELTGMAKFAYISQTNSIDSQVRGYEDKTGTTLIPPCVGGAIGGCDGSVRPPTLQVQEKEEVQEKVEQQDVVVFSFKKSLCALGLKKSLVDDFLKNRKLKRLANTETAFKNLVTEFNKNEIEITELMTDIVSNGWGSFKNSWLEKEKKVAPKKEKIGADEIIFKKYGISKAQ